MRLANLHLYWYLWRTFRNGGAMIRRLRHGGLLADGEPLPEALVRDGTRVVHPAGSAGLLGSLIEIWYEGCYDPPGFYRPKAGEVVVDVGANVGVFSLWLLRRAEGTRVVAIEPTPDGFACLERNLASYVAGGRAVVHRLAAAAGRGHVRIERPTGRSIDVRTAAASADEPERIEALPLADLLALAGAAEVALLKVDIEGAERELFATASAADLRRCRRIALEYHDNLRPGTLAMLRERFAATHEVTVAPKAPDYGMLFAIRRD
jgi:FkbM family methyltransferase